MKKLIFFLVGLFILTTACTKKTIIVKSPAPIKNAHAPGQIKKVTGSKSAAPYAPGQVKKSASASSANSKGANSKGSSGKGNVKKK